MPEIEITATIIVDEDEYKHAMAKGFQKHYLEPMQPSEIIELDDADDFLRALPFLYIESGNITVEIF